jgi:hypothetical protein
MVQTLVYTMTVFNVQELLQSMPILDGYPTSPGMCAQEQGFSQKNEGTRDK